MEVPSGLKTMVGSMKLEGDGSPGLNPNLREVRVVVRYKVYGSWRQYVMTTYRAASARRRPYPGQGLTVDGVATDVVGMLTADNAFLNVAPDRVTAGQLMMIQKGSFSTLVQVTSVDYAACQLTFANGDSLNLNQSGAASGSLAALNAEAPANSPANTMISRVRLITYDIDASLNPERPRLVRRVNNGDPMTFDHTLGTAVAFDVPNLQFTDDINNGTTNPGNVGMVQADLDGTGACAPHPCGRTLVRKVNIEATGRSMNRIPPGNHLFKHTLKSQVSLRGMAFVDRYRS